MTKSEIIEANRRIKMEALKKKKVSVMSPQKLLVTKLLKQTVKYSGKNSADKKTILELIKEVDSGENTLKLISNKFDSPNIITSVLSKYKVKECFISTWAVTPVGILRLKEIDDLGVKVTVLLDQTHSYKFMFESGAVNILKNVQFVFTQNHSKFMIFDIENELPINFIGSFNLSNNPRYENIEINRSKQEYQFYSGFIKSVQNGENESQKTLF